MTGRVHRKGGRAGDEAILRILSRLARGGERQAAIGRAEGVTGGAIWFTVKGIRDADLAESGEPRAQVAPAYLRGGLQ